MAQQQRVGEHAATVMPTIHDVETAEQRCEARFAHHQDEARDEEAGAGPGGDDRDASPERQVFRERPPDPGEREREGSERGDEPAR